jgi:hypothetical protein
MATYEQRRDERFYGATIAVLKDIEERALQLPQEQRYAVSTVLATLNIRSDNRLRKNGISAHH